MYVSLGEGYTACLIWGIGRSPGHTLLGIPIPRIRDASVGVRRSGGEDGGTAAVGPLERDPAVRPGHPRRKRRPGVDMTVTGGVECDDAGRLLAAVLHPQLVVAADGCRLQPMHVDDHVAHV